MDKLQQTPGLSAADEYSHLATFSTKELVEQVNGFVRRQYPIIALILGCVIALSLVYLFTASKLYTAHAKFLIDTTKMQILQQQQQVIGELPLDTAQVETQIEVLKSEGIGLAVVKDLKLTEDPEFVGSHAGFIGALINLIFSPFSAEEPSSTGSTMSEDALARRALGRFMAMRDVKRVVRTYVLDISYTSLSPGRAATVANAIADAYLTDQLNAKYQASRRASKWLQDRIGELRNEAIKADRAVLEFKEQKNIVDVGGRGGSGQLLTDQRVVDLNAELAKARADTAEAKARLDRIQVIMQDQSEVPDAAVTDSLSNSVISQLRTQYLEYDRRYHVYAERYGSTHLAVINLQTQMAELRRSMSDELARIAESYKSSYEIAKSRAESIENSLVQQISGAQLTNRERLGLDELESKAKAYHSIHDSFLQRYMEVTQQQSLPITEARLITMAVPPGRPSSPQTLKILFIAGVIGLALSFGAASLREASDRVFRTTRQVEQILKINCLAVLPLVKSPSPTSARDRDSESYDKMGNEDFNVKPGILRRVINEPLSTFAETFRVVKTASDLLPVKNRTSAFARDRDSKPSDKMGTKDSHVKSGIRSVIDEPLSAFAGVFRAVELTADSPLAKNPTSASASNRDSQPSDKVGTKDFNVKSGVLRHVIDQPLSAFAEAFRAVKVAADISGSIKQNKVIGITSSLPHEGKSTVASNFAELIAHSGKKVILVDSDLRNPTLSHRLVSKPEVGLLEVLAGKVDLSQAIYTDSASGLDFLPTVIETRLAHSSEIVASEVFRKLIDGLRETYDYIILDLPPLAPVVDVRATINVIDSYVFVIEWGRTRINMAQRQLGSTPEIFERLLGAVVNKANVRVLDRYEDYYGRYYYKKDYYARYGYTRDGYAK